MRYDKNRTDKDSRSHTYIREKGTLGNIERDTIRIGRIRLVVHITSYIKIRE